MKSSMKSAVKRGAKYNGCSDPCDTDIGPCACGAWHNKKVYPMNELLFRTWDDHSQPYREISKRTARQLIKALERFVEKKK